MSKQKLSKKVQAKPDGYTLLGTRAKVGNENRNKKKK